MPLTDTRRTLTQDTIDEAVNNLKEAVELYFEGEDLELPEKELQDLRIPPANRLERLKGDRIGQYSIRINDQWRICFIWNNANASDVEIVDYH